MAAAAAPGGPAAIGELESCAPAGDIMASLDGSSLSLGSLTDALRRAGDIGDDVAVTGVEVVPGSELRWPQSHSAKLRLVLGPAGGRGPPRRDGGLKREHSMVYLKKVIAQGLPPKPLSALRRDLVSNRNEARFYREFAPLLSGRGLPLLQPLLVDERIAVDAPPEGAAPGPSGEAYAQEEEAALRRGGMLLLLESADGYWQTSPLDTSQAAESLRLLAKLHASAWQDAEFLSAMSGRLHRIGGYWTLDKRGEEEMRLMRTHWQQYVEDFAPLAPELFARPGIAELAARIERLAPWVARELAPTPEDPFATLIHGDYKAMNIFLRESEAEERPAAAPATASPDEPAGKRRRLAGRGAPALPIDFQWTGLGFGMSDVAMHLSHSVATTALGERGERALVELYHRALVDAAGESRTSSYTTDVAWHHYCLGVVDYARMVLGCFFKNASQEAFAKRSQQPNVGLAYRDAQASLLFVERVDRCLAEVERRAP